MKKTQKGEKSHKSFYLLSENMSSTHDQENGAKKSPIFNMCSQMSGFCYDSAKEIAVKFSKYLCTYLLTRYQSRFFVQVGHETMYAAKIGH